MPTWSLLAGVDDENEEDDDELDDEAEETAQRETDGIIPGGGRAKGDLVEKACGTRETSGAVSGVG